jgi:hypothetical protein
MQPIAKSRPVLDKDWKALEENLELLLHTFKHAWESGMMSIVLHVNTLQMMYQKWPAGDQAKWWMAVTGVSPMDQPEAFLKYIEKRYPVVSMLASQVAIITSIGGGSGSSSGNGSNGNYHKKKKEELKKASVNAAPVVVPAEEPPVQPQQQYFQLGK